MTTPSIPRRDPAHDDKHLGSVPEFINLIHSGAMSQAVCVAAELGIADLLASGPLHVDELARATASHAPSLRRLLRALTSLALCTENEDGSFALAPTGSLLRADAQESLRFWTVLCGRYQWPAWEELRHSVKTGRSATHFDRGMEGFGRLSSDPEAARIFNGAMAELTRLLAADIVQAYDFAVAQLIVDVGGGHGALLSAILKAHPDAHGILFELPHAMAGARECLENMGLADRCQFLAGDFFEAVPSGGDVYILKNVLHDWGDERASAILHNCRRAVAEQAKLLLIERVLPSRFEASAQHRAMAWMDLTMLVSLGGRERAETEFRDLLASARFQLTKNTPTSSGISVLEAIPC